MGLASHTARRYPLHLTISAAFTALLLLLGGALIAFNYVESRRIARIGADEALERGAAAIAANTERLYRPARSLVDLSAHMLEPARVSPAAASPEIAELFREALDRNRDLSSVYLASVDGDFLLAGLEVVVIAVGVGRGGRSGAGDGDLRDRRRGEDDRAGEQTPDVRERAHRCVLAQRSGRKMKVG